jgi:hypothetical protein
MQNYLSTFLNYVSGLTGNDTPQIAGYTPPTQVAGTSALPPASPNGQMHPMRFDKQGNPLADLPFPNEKTIDVYPTDNYLMATKENEGTPQAALKLPVEYVNSLANAQAKSKSMNLLNDESLNQFLPLAIRESRFDDYGNNGVYVDYKTPPPKHLNDIIAKSNDLAFKQRQMEIKSKMAAKAGNKDLENHYDTLASKLQESVEALDAKLLADPKWTSRAESYKDITDKAVKLGLPQSKNQETIRDKATGKLISKADVYRARPEDTYDTKALHVPLALYAKSVEQPGLSGLNLSKAYIGSGKDADARIAQQANIYKNLTHPKNKDFYNAYNNIYNERYKSYSKGLK